MKNLSIKSKEDIAVLIECGRRNSDILSQVAVEVRPGITTSDLNDKAEEIIKIFGDKASFLGYKPEGARKPYPASLCVSVNEEIVHGISNKNPRTLKEGDIVSLDMGLTHSGMITDMAITVPVGKVSKDAFDLMSATKEALYAGIEKALPGGHIGDIGAAVQAVAKKRGFRVVEGLAGHGVGYAVHEDPFVPNEGRRGEGEELVSGMVIAIEPMLTPGDGKITLDSDGYTFKTKDGTLSAHFEHTVAITENGPVILTEFA